MKKISIVVPVYNEQENIRYFYQEVRKHIEPLGYQSEIIFVDDGSTDDTARIIGQLTRQEAGVKAIILARNFGHQIALTCGLDYADGDAVITMDGDMQHPPELLPVLISKWEEGYQVVQTVRLDTQGVSRFKRCTSSMFYSLINAMTNVRITEGGSDFRLMDRKVVETFRCF